jgi:putative Mn2+ efflux pump MntP
MHEKRRERNMGGIFIPAFLFIGLGIGLLIGQPGVGIFVGIGVGFIAMAAARTKQRMGTGLHSDAPEFISFLVGLMFVVGGIGLVYFPAMLWPYLGAAVLILIGLWFMFRGYRSFAPGKDEEDRAEQEDKE